MGAADVAALRFREHALLQGETRFDRSLMDELLHPEFVEFGRSGRGLGAQPVPIEVALREFAAHVVADDVVLVTFRTVDPGGRFTGNRNSLWVREQRVWRLRFHQGTPSTVDS